jgi:hypothetical protein
MQPVIRLQRVVIHENREQRPVIRLKRVNVHSKQIINPYRHTYHKKSTTDYIRK